MKKFLVLTKNIINVKYIQNIIIKDNKYIINLLSNNSYRPIIIENNDDDYKKITEFIESI